MSRAGDVVEDLGPLPYALKVEAMAGYGLSAADIAQVLDIELKDLESSYARQLAGGQIKANAKVAESLYRKALGEGRESVTAAIFWLKTRARWKATSVHEHVAGQLTHEFFLDCLEDRAQRFTDKIEEMAARQHRGRPRWIT